MTRDTPCPPGCISIPSVTEAGWFPRKWSLSSKSAGGRVPPCPFSDLKRFILLVMTMTFLRAGEGGKLAGSVRTEDGEPLPGANIVLTGTDRGAVVQANGEFFLLNIPPGTYDVKCMMIGYETKVVQGVVIRSDLTTRLDITLSQTVLDYEREVVVEAERPLIQKDVTSTQSVLSQDEIVDLPVETIGDILTTQVGFTEDASGGIHVRGGRTKEILYLVDGIEVRDPLSGSFPAPVNQNAIAEMTVISGTFNAEYGQAMSSVVNIITRDGSDKPTGRIEFLSDQLNDFRYHRSGAFPSVADTNFHWIDLKPQLILYARDHRRLFSRRPVLPLVDWPVRGGLNVTSGGRLPFSRIYYYLATRVHAQDSPLPSGATLSQDVQLKLTRSLGHRLKLSWLWQGSDEISQPYSHPWKYHPEHQAHTYQNSSRWALSLTHTLTPALYYTVSLNRQILQSYTGVQTKTPSQYVRPNTDASYYFYGSAEGEFEGDEGIYSLDQSLTTAGRFDLTWQANHRHLLKAGGGLTRHHLDIYTEEEPWVGGANFVDDSTFTPRESFFYVQDKLEFDYLILNIGFRWDQVDPRATMWQRLDRFVLWDSTASQWIPAPLVEVPAQSQWSPRIGIAYPVTVNTVFHFSYGHFFQTPPFDAFYYNAQKDLGSALPLVGNPRVQAQKTVAYETGVTQVLTPDISLTVTVWTKDIRGLLSTLQVRYLSNQYVVYTNTDYASVKGVDLSLEKRFSRGMGGALNYTYSVAKGTNANPLGGYFSAYVQEEVPHQEYYLSFDQRHDLALNLYLRTGHQRGPAWGPLHPLGGWTANLILNAGSGLPYTPFVDPTVRVEVNSARMPWTFTADLRLKKDLFSGRIRGTLFLEAKNLTDYTNVLSVYPRTGKPFDPGFSGVGTSEDANHNPAHLGPPRSLKAGFTWEW
ncbi:MAG: TonB-dependent receptor [Candidatus Neomarinimicrobiota bacterium]|nr:MAG: TonB-dependent receptor [Candidatus Neomarinimicrobiota bacterium]